MFRGKTHKSAAKRFKLTGRGKIARNRAYHSHLMMKKSGSRRRRLKKGGVVGTVDTKRLRRLLPGF